MFKLALCQMNVVEQKEVNLKNAEKLIRQSVAEGADMVALPEMFNCPYSNKFFRAYSEPEGGETFLFLSKLAAELNIYLIGGSIPEIDQEKIYNTAYIFNPEGFLIGKHRKVHLFDIDVKDGITFKESDVLDSGDALTLIDTKFGKVAVAICYDIRFPELTRLMAIHGAKLVVLPGAFNMTTGPAHWELSVRTRALDNQLYFAAVSPARDMDSSHYQAYGHSMVADPWGRVIAEADEKETIVYVDIDFEYEAGIRDQLPLLKHRRTELYKLQGEDFISKQVSNTIDHLRQNGFEVHFHETSKMAKTAILDSLKEEDSVGFGGSITLDKMGIYETLKENNKAVFWHWKAEGPDKQEILQEAKDTSVYMTSSNAITETGTLVNIDGTGNRLSSMLYGHERVIVVAGVNKIAKDYEEALLRIKNIACPLNAKRLKLNTPCALTGKCCSCTTLDSMCKSTLVLNKNVNGTHIIIHLVNEKLGY